MILSFILREFWPSFLSSFFSTSAATLRSSVAPFLKLWYIKSWSWALSSFKKSSSSFSILIAWCTDSQVIYIGAGTFLVCFRETLYRKIGANDWVAFAKLSSKQGYLIEIESFCGITFHSDRFWYYKYVV